MIGLSVHSVFRVTGTALIGSGGVIIAASLLALILIGAIFVWLVRKKKNSHKPRPNRRDSNLSVSETFKQLNGSSRTVLLAAMRINDLPATVPINLAIELAQKGKCLLVDFDSKRNPMSRAFELNVSKINTDLVLRPVPTMIDNLDVWPAGFFTFYKHMNLRMLLDAVNNKYEHVLLYAPYLPALPDRKQIAFCAKRAIVFSFNEAKDSPLHRLLDSQSCTILSQQKSVSDL